MTTNVLSIEKRNPFAPSTKTINVSSPSQSARPVTLPHIPELYEPIDKVLDALLGPAAPYTPAVIEASELEAAAAANPFMTVLKQAVNRMTTDNDAAAYKSTLSPTLDAFTSLSQATEAASFPRLLNSSWEADPQATLRIIWNLRSVHDGKSAREPFYRAFAWLYANHPRTAIANLRYLVEPCVKRKIKRKEKKADVDEDIEVITTEEATGNKMEEDFAQEITIGMPHGYWKDLLNILLLAVSDQLTPESSFDALHVRVKRGKVDKPTTRHAAAEGRTAESLARDKASAAAAKVMRLQKHKQRTEALSQKLDKDKDFRALYVAVARLFTDGLARDIGILRQIADEKTEKEQRISLAFELSLVGKWAPSIGGSHDRTTNIATPIAELLYAEGHFPLPVSTLAQPLSQEVAHRLRSTYTRWAISPLRRFLQIPEIAMSARQWDKVKYTRVPSKCMQMNKTHFFKHDEERFSQYLMDVAKGKKKISGATLLPHSMLEEAMSLADDIGKKTLEGTVAEMQVQVVEAQWKSMVARVKESGTLNNTLAVCDVSGSMGSITWRSRGHVKPISPAVALSILLSQVSRPPWANHFITFSQTPEVVALDPDAGLVGTAKTICNSPWGMNTDFNAVFTRLILPLAVENKLKPEDMIKRIFVYVDVLLFSNEC